MPGTRAYTYVDAGNARAGSPWMERSWSAFLGNTVSLLDRARGREWLEQPSQEIGLTADGETLDLMAFQGGNWSEECNPYGAVLECRLTGEALTLFARSTAMHDSPGMLRELRLLNRSRRALTVTGVVLDRLELALPAGRRESFRRVSDTAIAASDGTEALLVGHGADVAVEVNAERAPILTLRCRTDFELAPGQVWRLPDTYVLPYTGPFEQVSGREYASFLRAVRDLRAWEKDASNPGKS